MGKRQRRRRRVGGAAQAPVATTDHEDAEGNVLTLRNELSPATRAKLEDLDRRPASSQEDLWQRRAEFLFERLAVRWTIAGLPIESQRELLGRYRMADSETRAWVRETLDRHVEGPA